jgi:arsenate reductase-like glutaredoxin family protein
MPTIYHNPRILIEYPVLVERPIVTTGDKAWLARDEQSLASLVEKLS